MKTETFGARLQRLRIEAGLTQMQLAERAGVPLTSLRNWEHDRREPMTSALFKLVEALGVDCRVFAEPPLQSALRSRSSRPMGRPAKADAPAAEPAPSPKGKRSAGQADAPTKAKGSGDGSKGKKPRKR